MGFRFSECSVWADGLPGFEGSYFGICSFFKLPGFEMGFKNKYSRVKPLACQPPTVYMSPMKHKTQSGLHCLSQFMAGICRKSGD